MRLTTTFLTAAFLLGCTPENEPDVRIDIGDQVESALDRADVTPRWTPEEEIAGRNSSGAVLGSRFPRIVIDGEKLVYNEDHGRYFYKSDPNLPAMWLDAGGDLLLMHPKRDTVDGGKEQYVGGEWIALPPQEAIDALNEIDPKAERPATFSPEELKAIEPEPSAESPDIDFAMGQQAGRFLVKMYDDVATVRRERGEDRPSEEFECLYPARVEFGYLSSFEDEEWVYRSLRGIERVTVKELKAEELPEPDGGGIPGADGDLDFAMAAVPVAGEGDYEVFLHPKLVSPQAQVKIVRADYEPIVQDGFVVTIEQGVKFYRRSDLWEKIVVITRGDARVQAPVIPQVVPLGDLPPIPPPADELAGDQPPLPPDEPIYRPRPIRQMVSAYPDQHGCGVCGRTCGGSLRQTFVSPVGPQRPVPILVEPQP